MRRFNRVAAWRTRARALVGFVLLAAAVQVAAHDLVYLAAYGVAQRDQALVASGHGASWSAIVAGALLAAGALAALSLHRSVALRRRLAELGGFRVRPMPLAQLALRVARLWLPLLLVTVAVFVLQENLEHAGQHTGHLRGASVLYDAEYRWALPIFAALSLAAAAIGSLTVARLHGLAAAIASAEAMRFGPITASIRPSPVASLPIRRQRATPDLGRAPPIASRA